MENSKRSKGNSRSPGPGPVILVRVPPRTSWSTRGARGMIFIPVGVSLAGGDRGNDLSRLVKYILYRSPRPSVCHFRVIATSSVSCISPDTCNPDADCYLEAVLENYGQL